VSNQRREFACSSDINMIQSVGQAMRTIYSKSAQMHSSQSMCHCFENVK
jgi:hypothetical protein